MSNAGQIGLPIAGSLIGNELASGDQNSDLQNQEAALAAYQNVPTTLPTAEELQLALQQYQSAGQLTPQLEGTIQQSPSAYSSISTDPRLAQAQMSALASLQQQGQGGFNANDLAALAQAQQQAGAQAQAQSNAALQNLQERGQGGSGAELAARLSNAQGASNQLNNAGLQTNAMAQNRALQSIAGAGQLGGQIQNQQFNEQAQKAAAKDAINRFNAANAQGVLSQNVNRTNYGQQYNLGENQQLLNQNTTLANQEQQYNKNLPLQLEELQYQQNLGKANGEAGQYNNLGNYYGQQAQNTRQMWSNIGQGAGQMFAPDPSSSGGGGSSSSSGGSGGGAMYSGYDSTTGSYTPSNFSYDSPNFGSFGGDSSSMSSLAGLAHGGIVEPNKNFDPNAQHFDNGGMVQSLMSLAPLAMMALASDGGRIEAAPKQPVQHYDDGGMVQSLMALAPLAMMALASDGGKVPGHAEVPGNNRVNDTVPAMLSPGEIVVPRTFSHEPSSAKKFIDLVFKHGNHMQVKPQAVPVKAMPSKRYSEGGEVDSAAQQAKFKQLALAQAKDSSPQQLSQSTDFYKNLAQQGGYKPELGYSGAPIFAKVYENLLRQQLPVGSSGGARVLKNIPQQYPAQEDDNGNPILPTTVIGQ